MNPTAAPTNLDALDRPNQTVAGGNLLRMFQSESFHCHLHMYYLNSRKESGVHDYLVELLYKRPDNEVHFYLPQLCQLACSRGSTSLPRFLLDKSASSMHLALKANWLFQAAFEDNIPNLSKTANRLKEEIEMAVVNSKPFSSQQNGPTAFLRQASSAVTEPNNAAVASPSEGISDLFLRRRLVGFLSRYRSTDNEPLERKCVEILYGPQVSARMSSNSPSGEQPRKARILPGYITFSQIIAVPGTRVKLPSIYGKFLSPFHYTSFAKEYHGVLHNNFELQPCLAPQRRCEYFNTLDRFITLIIEVSNKLATEPDRKLRVELVKKFLESVDEWIFCRRCTVAASEGIFGMTGIALPFNKFSTTAAIDPDFLVRPTPSDTDTENMIGSPLQLLRIVVEESKVFSSRKRAPYLLVFELGDLDEDMHSVDQDLLKVVLEVKQRQSERNLRLNAGKEQTMPYKRGETVVIKPSVATETIDVPQDAAVEHLMVLPVPENEVVQAETTKSTDGAVVEIVESHAAPAPPPHELSTGTTTTSPAPIEDYNIDQEMEIINKLDYEWSDMYVYQSILQSIRERELYIPPFLGRPLTKDEWLCINDPRLRHISCALCSVTESHLSPIPMRKQDPQFVIAEQYAKCPFLCKNCKGTKIFYDAIINESPVDPIKRSLGVIPVKVPAENITQPFRHLASKRAVAENPSIPPVGQMRRRRGSSITTPMARDVSEGAIVRSASSGLRSSLRGADGDVESIGERTPSFDGAVSASPRQNPGSAGGLLPNSAGRESSSNSESNGPPGISPAHSTPALKTSDASERNQMAPLSAGQLSVTKDVAEVVGMRRARDSATVTGVGGFHPLKLEGETDQQQSRRIRRIIWGELWSEKIERIRKESPFGSLKTWRCGAVLVKGGDDVRQELLASQLIQLVAAIFKRADLPLWLYPYEILVTGANCGIIEFVPDTQSIDSIKQKFGVDGINKVFDAAFSDNIELARKNFIESHAGYSLISYLLQVKDRHNGNLLLTADGRLIHIDYGFMLSNCPGYVNFETSPFKLSAELMAIMQGVETEHFEYFRELMVKGFWELRKHYERLLLLIEMMFSASKMPCFSGNPEAALQGVKDKFMLSATQAQCATKVVELIELSVNNWRTQHYDVFQRFTNGIM